MAIKKKPTKKLLSLKDNKRPEAKKSSVAKIKVGANPRAIMREVRESVKMTNASVRELKNE
jgi:hypothetical protein